MKPQNWRLNFGVLQVANTSFGCSTILTRLFYHAIKRRSFILNNPFLQKKKNLQFIRLLCSHNGLTKATAT